MIYGGDQEKECFSFIEWRADVLMSETPGMLQFSRAKIKKYFSLEIAHIDINRLNTAFEHVPHYNIYRRRIRNLLGEKNLTRRGVADLFQLIDDLIRLCTRENLEIAFDLLKDDLCGRMGAFELTPDLVRFSGKRNENLIQQAFMGHSAMAFVLNILLTLDLRLREDDQAMKIHEGLGQRLRKISQLQMQTQKKKKSSEDQVLSEFIVAHSASIIKDLGEIANLSLSTDVRMSVDRHKQHVGDLLRDEIGALDQRISDALIFLSQLNKLSKSSRAFESKCRKSLEKMCRELLSVSYLVTSAERAVNDKDVLKGEVMDNVRLNLFFALLLCPHNEVFRGKYQSAVEGRLMLLSHYANYLHEIDFAKVAQVTFPQDSILKFEGMSSFAGKKPLDLVKELVQLESIEDKKSNVRWELYLAVELHLRNHVKHRQELEAVIAFKKLLIYQMFQKFTTKSMDSIKAMRDSIIGRGPDQGGMIYLPEDLLGILRDVCHCFTQLLDKKDERVVKLYRDHPSPRAYHIQEKLPKSIYRRQTRGAISKAKGASQSAIGDQITSLLGELCSSCEKNMDRDAQSKQLDKIIKLHSPYDGGLMEILDSPELLKKLMENPVIKNQSLNRKRLVQLLSLTRVILAS